MGDTFWVLLWNFPLKRFCLLFPRTGDLIYI